MWLYDIRKEQECEREEGYKCTDASQYGSRTLQAIIYCVSLVLLPI